jgi:hypothetical protein
MSDYTGGENAYVPQQANSHNFVDVNTLARHENPNYEGTPTQFFDNEGNLKAILADLHGQGSSQQFVDPYSFNPILKEGEKISADSSRQAHNENNELLFLDAEGNQTTRNTGTPMVGGTLRDVMYEKDPGSRGGFLPKDTYQAAALFAVMASLGTLGPAFLASEGALGAGALEGATAGELSFAGAGGAGSGGAGASGAGGLGALEGATAGEMSFSGAGGAGGLTDAQATALMQNNLLPASMQIPASSGLTATEALRYANLAKSGISSLTKATSNSNVPLTGAALTAAIAALASKSGQSSGSPSDTQPVNPVTFNWNYQAPDETDKYIARGQKILSPQYTTATMAQGGVTMLNHNQQFASGGISDLGGYSDGGRMLKGPGDGMSDSIPASIENKRPARLATDEFVVPADVVSHLGNGSSEAGAKVLYAMMDKVRKARTGNTKQGKQINPSNFMPG